MKSKKEEEEIAEKKKEKGKLFTIESEEKFNLSSKTYFRYFGFVKSWIAIAGVLSLYLISELFYTAFYYLFGSFDTEQDRERLFIILAGLLFVLIILFLAKYLLTVRLVGVSNTNMHNEMFL
jgi:hypothetical protein